MLLLEDPGGEPLDRLSKYRWNCNSLSELPLVSLLHSTSYTDVVSSTRTSSRPMFL